MKAVIPVAGLGTRMLPATKAIPKEMLPVVDRPLIQYVVNEAVAAGIKEIVLVTHSSKNSIENHFDTSFELEATLEKRVKRQLLAEVQAICPKDVTIIHVRQGEAKGLGHAISCAAPIIGNEPFVVILPDTPTVGAMIVAEQLRTAMNTLTIPHAFSNAANIVTMSFGVSTYYPHQTKASYVELVKSADRGLYRAKKNGRNRIELQSLSSNT